MPLPFLPRRPRNLRDATVLVTGASGGLGRALCLQLGAAGARVIAIDRDRGGLVELSAELQARGCNHVTHVCDITNAEATRRLMTRLMKVGVDVVVLNAGVTHIAPLSGTSPADFRRVLEVNLMGAFHVAQPLAQQLAERSGAIVGIASVAGFAPLLHRTAYAASKHALAGLLETVRTELPTVDVTVVYPAYIRTPLRDRSQATAVHTPGELTAEQAARLIVRTIEGRKRRLYIPARARLARFIWNLSPDLYIRLMLRETRSQRDPPNSSKR